MVMTAQEISEAIRAKTGTYMDPKIIQKSLDGKSNHPRIIALIKEVQGGSQ